MAKKYEKRHVVFFDFDNTITKSDVLDSIIPKFSKDDRWRALEDKWESGKIGSRECIRGQMKSVRITRQNLDRFLLGVKLDPYFKKIIKFLEEKEIQTIILSDNFDYILKKVLKNNDINNVEVYSNKVKFEKDKVVPLFPFMNKSCGRCAHCKKLNFMSKKKRDGLTIYIGDGRSDVCVSRHADIRFAKGYLMEVLDKEKKEHIPINGLKDVYDYFKRSLL